MDYYSSSDYSYRTIWHTCIYVILVRVRTSRTEKAETYYISSPYIRIPARRSTTRNAPLCNSIYTGTRTSTHYNNHIGKNKLPVRYCSLLIWFQI